MSCSQALLLHAYFDGELDAARALEFEAHVAGCSECRTELERQRVIRDAVAAASLYAGAPRSLRRRVQSTLPGRSLPVTRRLLWPALAAAIAIAVLGFWQTRIWREGALEQVAVAAVIDAHVRSLQPGHLTDVASSDQHTVKPWFAGRLDFSPPVNDLAAEGFPLLGGRLDVVGGRSVAGLVYGRHKHVITLFVRPLEGTAATALRSGSAHGYHWLRWERGGMSFWVVSDLASSELAEFVRLLQQ